MTGSCSFEYLRSDKEMIVRLSVLTAEMNEVAAVCVAALLVHLHVRLCLDVL